MVYRDKSKNLVIDVFLDKMVMCHTIDFRGRLELDGLSVSFADLVLSKMQVVSIEGKDVTDCITLLLDHPLASNDLKAINCDYIAKTLAKEWGFYYTVTQNLRRIRKDFKHLYEGRLTPGDSEELDKKLDILLETIEREPKSVRWRARAVIGPRMKWYEEVDFNP